MEPSAAGTATPRSDYASACNHYENRARYLPRANAVEFVTLLAEACHAAQVSLEADDGHQRAAAVAFLDRLVEFRDVIVTIGMERTYGANARATAMPLPGGGSLRVMPRVSVAGEFLIAHRMGLLSALDDWIGSGVQFSLALK